MSDATIRFSHYALYPVLSDDGQRMWASQQEPEAVANDVVFDSDLALIEAMASELASKPSDTTNERPGEAGDELTTVMQGCENNEERGRYALPIAIKQIATLQADCERWSAMYAKLADELVAVKNKFDLATSNYHTMLNERFLENSELRQQIEQLKARLVEVEAERNCLMVTGGSTNPFVVAEAIQRLKERAEAAEARVKELEGQIDANVAAVIAKHRSRADLGMQKYGVATANSDLTKKQWLLHLQEELMDAAVYVEAALAKS